MNKKMWPSLIIVLGLGFMTYAAYLHIRYDNKRRKEKRMARKNEISIYREEMRKLGMEEEEIDSSLQEIKKFSDLIEINSKLKQATSKLS